MHIYMHYNVAALVAMGKFFRLLCFIQDRLQVESPDRVLQTPFHSVGKLSLSMLIPENFVQSMSRTQDILYRVLARLTLHHIAPRTVYL